MGFDNASQTRSFRESEEANGLQFSLMMKALPTINLKIGSVYQGSKYQVGESMLFPALEATVYGGRKWLQTSRQLLS